MQIPIPICVWYAYIPIWYANGIVGMQFHCESDGFFIKKIWGGTRTLVIPHFYHGIEWYLGNDFHQLQHFHHLVGVISKLISTTSTISTISILQLGHCWSHFHHLHCFHYNKFGGVPEVIFTIFTISTIPPLVWGSTLNSFPFVPPFPQYGRGHLWRDLHPFETSTMGSRAISEVISSISTLGMGAIYEKISSTSTFPTMRLRTSLNRFTPFPPWGSSLKWFSPLPLF